ncbi:heterokaryon incompatibility protein-domain-containing protein [Phaeosphaeriaceae sp. PMI808]|nr:heterokaryon incompatibility protein-domain-containing protein [Phaeosphaeriaceae sp. PMI808]
MDFAYRPHWHPEKDLSMFDKIDRLENAISAILERLEMPKLESFHQPNQSYQVSYSIQQTEPEPARVKIMSKSGLYEYQKLDAERLEIRLLELNPADGDSDPLTGTLHTISLDDETPGLSVLDPMDSDYRTKYLELIKPRSNYNALSYTWGEPLMDSVILINGQSLAITSNLMTALKAHRKAHWSTNWWWIDQISINQSDIDERSQQVGLMREIYKKAGGVIVWLGNDGSDSKRAIATIKKVSQPPPVRAPGERARGYPKVAEEEVSKNWAALEGFFKAPWWERCWVRQEVALNSEVTICYGGASCAFQDIEKIFEAFKYIKEIGFKPKNSDIVSPRLKNPIYSMAAELQSIKDSSDNGRRFMELTKLLQHTRSCKATDPRDKIYSVLGLVDSDKYEVPVDYRLSLQKILGNAIRSIFTAEEYLNTLGMCQNPQRKHGLPSWAPNLLDEWECRPFEINHGSGFLRGSQQVVFTDDTLIVEGIHWEPVELLCDGTVPDNPTPEELDAVYDAWQQFVDEIYARPDLSESAANYIRYNVASEYEFKEAGWLEFLTIGKYYNRGEQIEQKTAKEVDSDFWNVDIAAIKAHLVGPSFDFRPETFAERRDTLHRYGHGRKLGVSKNLFLGLFPADAQKGDSIALIRGTSFPCVLRKHQGEDFVLVGEAYFPNIDGEDRNGNRLDQDSPCDTIQIV